MNTLDDLRRTLDTHAHDVHDDATHARTAAVRGRAVAVRRRRAAGVGAAAALAVVGALVAPQLVSDPDPQLADRTLLGRVAPETMQSLGYTYRFVEGVEKDGNASLRLPETDGPRLVTWASPAEEVEVFTTEEGRTTDSDRTAFDDFAFVHPGASGRWTVRAGGEPTALAVYELDEDALPAGTTVGGVTFRQEVANQQLVVADALDEGSAVLTVRATVPETERMWLAEFCQGVSSESRLWVNTSVDGDGATASGGCDEDGFDPAVGSGTWLEARHLPEPGEEVEVRMWVSRGIDGDPLLHEGARMALALYDLGEPAAVVGGWEMEPLVEHDGHLWSFVDSREATAGATRLEVGNDQQVPLLAIGSYERPGGVVTMRGADDDLFRSSAGAGGSSTLGVLQPGEQATVTVREPVGPRGSLGMALYERVD